MNPLSVELQSPRLTLIGTFTEPISDNQIFAVFPFINAAEFRADLYPNRDLEHLIEQSKKFGSLPVLLTIRHESENGLWTDKNGEPERLGMFKKLLPYVDGIDIELGSMIVEEVLLAANELGKSAIVSFHDFDNTPPNEGLVTKLEYAKSLGAKFVKFALKATSEADHNRQKDFAAAHPNEGLIMVPMDKHHPEKRLEIPTLATYVYVTDTPVAPGQLHFTQAIKIQQQQVKL